VWPSVQCGKPLQTFVLLTFLPHWVENSKCVRLLRSRQSKTKARPTGELDALRISFAIINLSLIADRYTRLLYVGSKVLPLFLVKKYKESVRLLRTRQSKTNGKARCLPNSVRYKINLNLIADRESLFGYSRELRVSESSQ
jgi:hypothetical protein